MSRTILMFLLLLVFAAPLIAQTAEPEQPAAEMPREEKAMPADSTREMMPADAMMEEMPDGEKMAEQPAEPASPTTAEIVETMIQKDKMFTAWFDSLALKADPLSTKMRDLTKRRQMHHEEWNSQLDSIIEANGGWPGKSVLGTKTTIGLIGMIQSKTAGTRDKYFPAIEEAVKAGEVKKKYFAPLIDMKRMDAGKPQLYGTQVQWDPEVDGFAVYPIEEEAQVNQRRKEIGMGSLADYLKNFGIDWQPPKAEGVMAPEEEMEGQPEGGSE